MAFPQVDSSVSAEDASAGTSHVITMPSGLLYNDLILGAVAIGDNGTTTPKYFGSSSNSGNINLSQFLYNVPIDWCNITLLYGRAIGGTDNDYITLTTTQSHKARWIIYRISDHGVYTFVQSNMPFTNDSAGGPYYYQPACPESAGTAYDWLWFSFIAIHGYKSATTAPSGFGSTINSTADDDPHDVTLCSARKEENTTQVAEGYWSTDLTDFSWNSITVGVKPGDLGGGSSGGVGIYVPSGHIGRV